MMVVGDLEIQTTIYKISKLLQGYIFLHSTGNIAII